MTNIPENQQVEVGNLRRSPNSPRTLFGLVMNGLVFFCVALALLPLLAVLLYVIVKGFSSINVGVFTQDVSHGGFGNAISGTIIMVLIGSLISIPFGVMAAIYLSEFSSGQIADSTRFATNVLSGVPSIIIGVFTYGVVVLTLGNSGFAGGVALSVLMLPIIVRTTDEALKLVPVELRQAAVGLGATNIQTVFGVILPAALPAIITGTTLAVARAAGETAPVLFTASFWPYWKSDPLKGPMASLSVLIYNVAAQATDETQRGVAWTASLILVLLVLLTSVASRLATARRIY